MAMDLDQPPTLIVWLLEGCCCPCPASLQSVPTCLPQCFHGRLYVDIQLPLAAVAQMVGQSSSDWMFLVLVYMYKYFFLIIISNFERENYIF